MASNSQGKTVPNIQATAFYLVMEKFKASLTDKEKTEFKVATLSDLHIAIESIQKRQATDRRLQGMQRLELFLEGMNEYDKVIQIFVNSSQILAFVWGPMKFLLQAACTFSEAFDSLMDAYQRIGEQIPLLTQYENIFRSQPKMTQVLQLFYHDILDFHWKAMRYFKQRMWKQLFHALWKSFNTEFSSILRNMREHRTLIESQASIAQLEELVRTRETTSILLERTKVEETHRRLEVVREWLSAVQSEVEHEHHQKVRQEYPRTGKWLLNHNRFHAWFDPDFCSIIMLWLSGIPGAGKTILASLVIDEVQKLPGVSVSFFYCKYEDTERNTFLAVARGILSQLLHQDETLLPYLYEKASKSGQTVLTSNALAKELLTTSIKNCKKLYVVLDGIDECDREERKEIVSVFEEISESFSPDDADEFRCMFVSQDDSLARKDFSKMVLLKITDSDVEKDIRTYAAAWSAKIQSKFELTAERQKFIEDSITAKAEGMFLFAKLMSSYLYSKTTVGKLEEDLAPGVFPHGQKRLDEVYSRILCRLGGNDGLPEPDAIKLLSWLVCAKRPLKWREVQCAVSIDLDEGTVEWTTNRFRVDSKDLCGSLVELHTDDTVSLVHHTAKRYLVANKHVDVSSEEFVLTSLCVGYLTFPGFEAHVEQSEIRDYLSLGYYGFTEYAYAYWSRHLEKTTSVQMSSDKLNELSEAVDVFVDMHWTEPQCKIPTPKSILERLKPLRQTRNFEKIASAAYTTRKKLNLSSKFSRNDEVLDLGGVVEKIRLSLEEMVASTIDKEKIREMYGANIFKCPRLDCTRFYNGFSTKQLRDDHVPKHERTFFCSFPSCPTATFGCTTLKELQKHETDVHKYVDFEDDDDEGDFPELPVQKPTFDCDQCNTKFTRKHNLTIHMRTHNAPASKEFICSTCGKGFARQGDRTRHESTFHGEPKVYTCGGALKSGAQWGCGQTFNRKDVLARHYRSEKGRNCLLPKQEEEAAEIDTPLPK